jgi:hypothetical protein
MSTVLNRVTDRSAVTREFMLLTVMLFTAACTPDTPAILVTIADARDHAAEFTDVGKAGDSTGDILTFDQPLLNQQGERIGNNSGTCIRTRVDHSFQCQWTLTMANGSIQVAGREFDQGTSTITIVGGTGQYAGISGQMVSVNNGDGTFTQTLSFWHHR